MRTLQEFTQPIDFIDIFKPAFSQKNQERSP
jgi:hypothetical protein